MKIKCKLNVTLSYPNNSLYISLFNPLCHFSSIKCMSWLLVLYLLTNLNQGKKLFLLRHRSPLYRGATVFSCDWSVIDEVLRFLIFVHRDVGEDKQLKRLLVTAWNRSRTSRWLFLLFLCIESFVTSCAKFLCYIFSKPTRNIYFSVFKTHYIVVVYSFGLTGCVFVPADGVSSWAV